MSRVLDSAYAKLRWADKHLDTLKNECERFINSQPYSCIKETHPDPPQYIIRAMINHGVPAHWGLIIGDYAHNSRSALDMLVQSISTLPPNGEDRTRLQFPICTTSSGYHDAVRRRQLHGITPSDMAIIESVQPYKGRSISLDPIFVLQQLNNADKHRLIHVVGAVARSQRVTMPWGPYTISIRGGGMLSNDEHIVIRYKTLNDGLVTHDGAIVAECTLQSPEMDVNSQIEIQILFDKTLAVPIPHPVLATLTDIRDRVEEIIGRFA